jgi:hypothetical protein
VFVLRDAQTLAIDLLRHDPDIVITTYQFVYAQAARVKDYLRFIKLVKVKGLAKAVEEAHKHRLRTTRPVVSLYSSIYQLLPFRHVVCDEAHLVKNIVNFDEVFWIDYSALTNQSMTDDARLNLPADVRETREYAERVVLQGQDLRTQVLLLVLSSLFPPVAMEDHANIREKRFSCGVRGSWKKSILSRPRTEYPSWLYMKICTQ